MWRRNKRPRPLVPDREHLVRVMRQVGQEKAALTAHAIRTGTPVNADYASYTLPRYNPADVRRRKVRRAWRITLGVVAVLATLALGVLMCPSASRGGEPSKTGQAEEEPRGGCFVDRSGDSDPSTSSTSSTTSPSTTTTDGTTSTGTSSSTSPSTSSSTSTTTTTSPSSTTTSSSSTSSTSTTTGGPECGNRIVEEGEQCDDGNLDGWDGCEGCKQVYRVFATAQQLKGDVGGLAGADKLCQGLADDSGMKGVFRAWLSADGLGPKDRFETAQDPVFKGIYRLPTSDHTVALGWLGLTTEDLLEGIQQNEKGLPIDGAEPVWSNTTPTGQDAGGPDCDGWTNNTLGTKGRIGATNTTTNAWTDLGDSAVCSTAYRIYCMQVAPPAR